MSRSERAVEPRSSSGRPVRSPADHLRVTVPVSIDQNASRMMAPNAQNL